MEKAAFVHEVKGVCCLPGQSVKGFSNYAFLQKDQLCYLKRAEKLTFCIYFS